MQGQNNIEINRFLAHLLHPSAVIDTSYFPAPQIFWDRLVQLSSGQLVLPAIYGALKRKKLINHVPVDLVSYLKEITDLNKNRNNSILKQMAFLSGIFNRDKIDHVFLKGAAILIAKPYEAINERMVGDIDILVSEKDLSRAQQLLINNGYNVVSKEFNFTKDLDFAKHLKRIVHPNFIAAVEIHRNLLDLTLKKPILSQQFLNEKLQNSDGFYIPSKTNLWQHAIFNWQYNDLGMIQNSLAFRSVMDVLYLEPKDIVDNLETAPKAIKHFYSLLSLYYDNYTTYFPLNKLRYKWQLSYWLLYKLNNFYFRLGYLLNIGFIRLDSKTYRKRVLNNPKLLVKKISNFWNK
ncbi:MAG: hypothetical protein CMG00_04250 [Candidatus Marinimicrobia bacterium]|nr:hypothetical protein [Candidatus Neomarinimicrobiota bacterium]|tara:strand:- start:91 stop:1137 length:1047 start_codon:yes stop_codon:yes gene_type:complete